MANKKVTGWFTMNGKHIPMFEGESKDDAVKRAVSKGKSTQPVTKEYKDKKSADYEKAKQEHDTKMAEQKKTTARYYSDTLPKKDRPSAEELSEKRKAETAAYIKMTDAEDKKNDADSKPTIKSVIFKKKSTVEKNEDIKQKQIAQAKADADKASGKKSAKENDKDSIAHIMKERSSYDADKRIRADFQKKIQEESDKYGNQIKSAKDFIRDTQGGNTHKTGDTVTIVEPNGKTTTLTYNEREITYLGKRDLDGKRKISTGASPMWEIDGKPYSNIISPAIEKALKQGGRVYHATSETRSKIEALKKLKNKSDDIFNYATEIGNDVNSNPKKVMRQVRAKFNLSKDEAEYAMTKFLGWSKDDLK